MVSSVSSESPALVSFSTADDSGWPEAAVVWAGSLMGLVGGAVRGARASAGGVWTGGAAG
jgi:hypothetical protein